MRSIVVSLVLSWAASAAEPVRHHATLRCDACHVSFKEVRERAHQPGSLSRMCLSCHDGSTAKAISHTHPVGMIYDHVSEGLHDPHTTRSGWGGSVADDLLAGGRSVECTTCHDPHGRRRPPSLGSADALCVSCHKK